VRVSVCEGEAPTITFPKLRLEGFVVTLPAATPVPESAIVSRLPDPLLVIVRVPLAAPADCGLNITVKDALCPAESVIGKLKPDALNAALLAVTWLMVTSDVPILVRVSERVWLVPLCTFPKLTLAGEAVRSSDCEFWDCEPDFPELNPWHPIMNAEAAKAIEKTRKLRAGKWLMFEF
jgi:hypothetical protein